MLFKKKDSFSVILKKYFTHRNETQSIQPLSEFFQSLKKENFDVFHPKFQVLSIQYIFGKKF